METERVLLIGGKMNFFWVELEEFIPAIAVPVMGRTLQPNSSTYSLDEEYEKYYLRGYIINGEDRIAIYGTEKMSSMDCEVKLLENYKDPLMYKD